MQKRRLFVSIPFSGPAVKDVGSGLDLVGAKLPPDIYRYYDAGLWHITVLFLGDQSDEDLASIVSAMEEVASNQEEIIANFYKIDYGPDDKERSMLWLWGDDETSRRLGALRDELQDALIARGVPFNPDNRKMRAHVTLARVGPRTYPTWKLSVIHEPVAVELPADELALMESHLADAQIRYEELGSFSLIALDDEVN